MRRLLQQLLVVAFVATLAAPGIANLAGADGADARAENRTLADFPALSPTWSGLTGFVPGLERWFSDHFGFRAALIRWYGISRYFWLGVSPNRSVAIGSDGWLFYADDGGLDDFTNAHPLSEPEIINWRETIARARDWCRARGIGYAFAILPDKTSIYPERFPQTARRVSRLSRADQVITAITDLGVAVDVRPALLREKRRTRVYQKTDTHWNARGAYEGYRVIIDALRLQVPSIPPARPPSDFKLSTTSMPGMDLAGMIGLTRVLGEQDIRFEPVNGHRYVVVEPEGGTAADASEGRLVTEIPGSDLPRAVVFRDSFMSAVAPYLSDHFSRVVYLWRDDFAADEVEKEHPDVVLQEMVSRHLQWFVPYPELIPAP